MTNSSESLSCISPHNIEGDDGSSGFDPQTVVADHGKRVEAGSTPAFSANDILRENDLLTCLIQHLYYMDDKLSAADEPRLLALCARWALDYLGPYLHSSKPVSVSLERGAQAIDEVLGLIEFKTDERPECLLDCMGYDVLRYAIVKAVLDAAGVKYVD